MLYNQKPYPLIISIILLHLTVLVPSSSTAQYESNGTVIDQATGEPLAFVSIVFNNNPHLGTTTDIDGYFHFEHTEPLHKIDLSYVGYNATARDLDTQQQGLLLQLQKTNLALEEITIIAGENPAYRIIRRAAHERQQHNPEKIAVYQCDSYQKIRVYDKSNAPQQTDKRTSVDSNQATSQPINFFYFMLEITSKIKQKAPDLYNEHIIATQITGIRAPIIAPMINALQPTNFHRENFLILDKEYLNPIADNSIRWYEFRLEDTLYQGIDTIFRISFFPRKGKKFDALKGVLLINTNGYAIQTVRASPANTPKISLCIEQQYAFIQNKYWFPQQLNFEIRLSPYGKDTFTLEGKRYLSAVDFATVLHPKDFTFNQISIAVDAQEKDSIFWKKQRTVPLSTKEKETYKIYKKMERKPITWLANTVVNSLNELAEERIQLGDVSVNYAQLLEFNAYEKFRLGLGIYNSYQWNPYLSIGGYFAYGFGDKKWKYGASLLLRPNPLKDVGFQISYINDVLEPAAIIQNTHSLSKKVLPAQSFVRRNILSQMDQVEEVELSAYMRFAQHFKGRIFGNWSYHHPLYTYSYLKNNKELHSFRLVRMGIQFRFSYKERLVQTGTTSTPLSNRYPTFYLSYTKSFEGLLDGHFNYHKLIFGMESSFFIKGLGRLKSLLQAGFIAGEAPYPMLFNGRGSYQKSRIFLVRNTFQTMAPNEFVNKQFIYGFIEHDFGNLLFQFGKFKPQLKLYQAAGIGWLNNNSTHQGMVLSDMRKGYFESGIMLSDIIRLPILNIGYFGLGAGVFVRYGAYKYNKFLNNLTFKIDMTTSF